MNEYLAALSGFITFFVMWNGFKPAETHKRDRAFMYTFCVMVSILSGLAYPLTLLVFSIWLLAKIVVFFEERNDDAIH